MKKENKLKYTETNSNSVFAESIRNLTADDIILTHKVDRKRSKSSRIQISIMFFICIIVFVVCAYKIGENLIGKYIGDNFYNEIANDFLDFENGDASETTKSFALSLSNPSKALDSYETRLENRDTNKTSGEPSISSSQLAIIRAKLNAMKMKNDEIFGFIKVTGTNIAYTLVHHDDNDFYLTHSTEKNPLVIGSIFLDYRNSTDLRNNYNSIIYGHNMTSGSMFHEIQYFDNNRELFESSLIYIYTLEGIYIYKPFSFYRTTSDSDYIRTSFANSSEFTQWANNVKSRSQFETDTEISESMDILTLSTCINYSYNNKGRYALHAVLIEIISD